jgi:hypothetical protein
VAIYDRNASRTVFNKTPIDVVALVTMADGQMQEPSYMSIKVFSDDSFVVTLVWGPSIRYISTAYDSTAKSYSIASSNSISNTASYYNPRGQTVLSDVLLLPANPSQPSGFYQGLMAVERDTVTKSLHFTSNSTYGASGASSSVKPCYDSGVASNVVPLQYAMVGTSSHVFYVCGVCAGVGAACNGNYNVSFTLRAFRRLSTATSYNFSAGATQSHSLAIGRTLSSSNEAAASKAEIFLNTQWIGVYIHAVPSSGSYQTAVFVYNRTSSASTPFQATPAVLNNAAINLPGDESTTAPAYFSFGGTYLGFQVNDAKTAIYASTSGSFPTFNAGNRVSLLDPSTQSSGATSTPKVELQGDVAYGVATYLVNSPQSNNMLLLYAQNSCPVGNALIRYATYDDCQPCASGTINTVGSEVCSLCSSSLQYAANIGMSACQTCPTGHVATPNRTSCIACAPGSFLDSQQGACVFCSAGTFQALSAQTSCQSCAEGTYQPFKGTTNCSLCPTGTYNSETGKRSCSRCEAGYYSNVTGRTSIDDCNPCDLGFFSPTSGSSSCSACSAGTYADRPGLTVCFQCPVGTYLTQAGGSSVTMCTSCAAGTYGAASGSKACLQCPPGTYTDERASTSCKTCPSDYRNSASGLNSQSACDAPNTTKIMLFSMFVAGFSSLVVAFGGLIFKRYFLGLKLFFFKWKLAQARKKRDMYRTYIRIHDVPAVFAHGFTSSEAEDAGKKVHPAVPECHSPPGAHGPSPPIASPVVTSAMRIERSAYLVAAENSAPSTTSGRNDGIVPEDDGPIDPSEEFYADEEKHVRLIAFEKFTQELRRAERPVLSFCTSLFLIAGLMGSLVGLIIFSILLAQENAAIEQADGAASSSSV